MKIQTLPGPRCELGEGPLWDHQQQCLFWVDSLGPDLYCFDIADRGIDHWRLPGRQVGSLALRAKGGLILAMDQGFYRFDPASDLCELIANPLAGREQLRFNDGKVDPQGSFVAGAMNIDGGGHENCPMYRLTPDFEVIEILDGFSCFNGPCFSEDGQILYVCGRHDGVIEAFDYGELPQNPRQLITGCNPDGATVDADGYLWSAQWDHECLLRIAPDGSIERRLMLPEHVISSVMFGGPELELIFVTTVAGEINGVKSRSPDAGSLLIIEDSGYRGRVETLFKG